MGMVATVEARVSSTPHTDTKLTAHINDRDRQDRRTFCGIQRLHAENKSTERSMRRCGMGSLHYAGV